MKDRPPEKVTWIFHWMLLWAVAPVPERGLMLDLSQITDHHYRRPLRRAYSSDITDCPRCGGQMKVIATIQSPYDEQGILDHLSGDPAANA